MSIFLCTEFSKNSSMDSFKNDSLTPWCSVRFFLEFFERFLCELLWNSSRNQFSDLSRISYSCGIFAWNFLGIFQVFVLEFVMEFLQELQGFVLKFPHGFDFPEILRAFFLQFDFFLEIFPEISGEIFLDFFFWNSIRIISGIFYWDFSTTSFRGCSRKFFRNSYRNPSRIPSGIVLDLSWNFSMNLSLKYIYGFSSGIPLD